MTPVSIELRKERKMIATGVQALLKVKRLTKSAKLPERGTVGSAGLDIFADEEIALLPDTTSKVSTGIAIELPPGTVGLFLDRGSLGSNGIHNFAGVIDADYRGELFVVLHNATNREILIKKEQKITQMVVLPYIALHPYEVKELSETMRGAGAFGSTGV